MRRFELNAEEDQFYNQCWRTLDIEGQGQVQGRACVLFFKKSNLPVDVLKKVWILSATDAQILYKQEFFIALRLIAYAQAGFELTETIIQEGRPIGLARIEGIQYQQPVLQPPPQMIIPPQQSLQMSASQSSQIYPQHAEQFQTTLEQNRQFELANDQYIKYEQYYNAQDKQQTGMVPGPEARAIFEKSQLPKQILLQIWSLVDQGQKGYLQKSEFIVAIHLISLAKRGVQIPTHLTDQLLQLIKPQDSFIQPQTQRLPNPQSFQTLQPQSSNSVLQNSEISSLNNSSLMLQQKLTQQISQIATKNESESQLIEEKKKEIEFYNQQIKKLSDILAQVNQDRDSLKQQFASLSDVANQKQQQVQQIQTQISDQLTQNQQLKQQIQQRENDSRQQSLGYQQVPAPASYVPPSYQQTQQISGFEVIGQVQNNNQNINNPPPSTFNNNQQFQQQPPQVFQQQPPQGFQQQPPQLPPQGYQQQQQQQPPQQQFQQQPPQLPQSVIDLLENQLRKFRDYADQRDKDVYELENKINRQNQDFEIIEGRLLKDNEHLRIKNQESEREHQIDMNGLRQKLDMLNQGQLENTKQQYITQIEIMDNEIDKLKGLLDIKNTEIDSLIIQNQRLRQNYDEELQTARMQFEILKEKMLENEQQYQTQSEQAQLHIRKANEAEVAALVQRYQNEIDILIDSVNNLKKQCENQNQSVHSLNYDKNLQLETSIKDKAHLNTTISKKHDDIEQLLKQIERLTILIGLKDEQLEKLSETYIKIKLGLDKQLQKLQTEFEHLQIESNSNIKKQLKEIQKLSHHIKELEQKIEHLNQQHVHQNQNHLQSIAQLKQKNVHLTTSNKQLQSQVNDLTEHGQNLEHLLHEQQQKSADEIAQLKSHHDKDLLLLKAKSDQELEQVKVDLVEAESKFHKVLSQVQSDSIQQNDSQNQLNERYIFSLCRLNEIQDQLEEVIDQNDLHKQLVAAYNLKGQLQNLQGTA